MSEFTSSPVYPDLGSDGITTTGAVRIGLKNAVRVEDEGMSPGGGRRLADPVAREITIYRLRALDLGADPPVPVYWTSQSPTVEGAPAPPHGGPYADVQILTRWTQTAPRRA